MDRQTFGQQRWGESHGDASSRREDHPVESAALRLLVHKTGVGAIIGKMGATIKEIQAETGARVQVSNETLLHAAMLAIALFSSSRSFAQSK